LVEALSLDVEDSILGEVIGFFDLFNLSSHTISQGFTQPLTEIQLNSLLFM
jgi:hypothetical protein